MEDKITLDQEAILASVRAMSEQMRRETHELIRLTFEDPLTPEAVRVLVARGWEDCLTWYDGVKYRPKAGSGFDGERVADKRNEQDRRRRAALDEMVRLDQELGLYGDGGEAA